MKKKRSLLNKLTLGLIGTSAVAGSIYLNNPQNGEESLIDKAKESYDIYYHRNFIENSIKDLKKYSSIYDKLLPETKSFITYISKIHSTELSEREIKFIILNLQKITNEVNSLLYVKDRALYNRNLQLFYNNYFLTFHNSTIEYLKKIYGEKYHYINTLKPLKRRDS